MKLEDLINPKRAEQRRRLAHEEKIRIEKEQRENDPNYYTYERFGQVIAPYRNEPIQKEYVTKEMISLMVTSIRERGLISFGGGWRMDMGEEYLNMKGGWTPTIAEAVDPIIFYRKSRAAHWVAKTMHELWEKGYMDKLMGELLEMIDKEFNQ